MWSYRHIPRRKGSPILPPLARADGTGSGTRLVGGRQSCQMLSLVADIGCGYQSATERTFQGKIPGLHDRRL